MNSDKSTDLADIARSKSYKLDPLWDILKEMNVQEELIDTLKSQISERAPYKETIEELKAGIDRLQNTLIEQNTAIKSQESDMQRLKEDLQRLKGQGQMIEPFTAEISNLKSRLESQEGTISENSQLISGLKNVLEEINFAEIQRKVNEHEEHISGLAEKFQKEGEEAVSKKKPSLLKRFFAIILVVTALGFVSFFQYKINKEMVRKIDHLEVASKKDRKLFDQKLEGIDTWRKDIGNSSATINEYIPKMASLEEGLRGREREIRNISIHVGTLQDVLERLELDLEMTQERISTQEKRLNNIDGGIAELIQMSDNQSKQVYGTGSDLAKLKKAVERLDAITSKHSAILQKSKK